MSECVEACLDDHIELFNQYSDNLIEHAKSLEARIEALEDFNYRRRKAYRDRVIDALHNIDTEESPELEDALNLAHNAIYNAVTKALLEGE